MESSFTNEYEYNPFLDEMVPKGIVEPVVGVKFDQGKLGMHLLPPELLIGVSSILDFGAKKYAPRNWEKGMDWSRVFSSLMRHMWAWWRGEDKDPETGMSHLWHAGCNIAFLIAYEERKVGKDDRPNS
jgi:hypothetical protein